MKAVGRKVARLIPVLLCAIGLLWPVLFSSLSQGGAAVADPVVFSDFRADFTVDRDGVMQATETITAEFPPGRHGIFRFWDIANPNDSHARQVPDVTEISLDDQPVNYELSWKDNERFLVAKVGDAGYYLSTGTHIFRIRYSVAGVETTGSNCVASS